MPELKVYSRREANTVELGYVCVCVCVCVCVYHIFFIHLTVDGHSGCAHILATVNNASMNAVVHVSFWIGVFGSFGYIPRSGNIRSYDSSIFSFQRNLHTVFHSGRNILHSHKQRRRRILFSPHTFSSTMAILTSVQWYFIIVLVLVCISLIISNFEPLFMCLLAICISSLEVKPLSVA